MLKFDTTILWFLFIGLLLTVMGAFQSVIKRLPLTTAMIYLPVGYAIGPHGLGLFSLDPLRGAKFVEHLSELVVLVSLFTAGLKLRSPLSSKDWIPAFRLATVSMFLTIAGIALASYYLLGFPLGAAVLVGAILAPTDPVLASGVQVRGPTDRDPIRFSLTGEAGLNDGTAFPFIMLGLGLLGMHELGENGMKWLASDVIWAGAVAIALGSVLGSGIARLIHYFRAKHKETAVLDDFLTIGLICLLYGTALAVQSYGFLAVFAAGVALRRSERIDSAVRLKDSAADGAGPDSDAPPAQTARAVLTFNEQLERLGEVVTVLLVGAMIEPSMFVNPDLLLVPILFLVIRPLAVFAGLAGVRIPKGQRSLIAWFGVRGIGSVYYLSYAITRNLPGPISERLVALVLSTVALSILIHGLSVSPLMDFYQSRLEELNRLRKRRASRLQSSVRR